MNANANRSAERRAATCYSGGRTASPSARGATTAINSRNRRILWQTERTNAAAITKKSTTKTRASTGVIKNFRTTPTENRNGYGRGLSLTGGNPTASATTQNRSATNKRTSSHRGQCAMTIPGTSPPPIPPIRKEAV